MRTHQDAPLVICGHGMVAQRLMEHLVALGHPFSRIVVFNGEPTSAYNRIQLSALLADQISERELELKPRHWFHQHQIEVFDAEPVTTIKPDQQLVVTASGRVQPFSKLVLTTGSRPTPLGIPGEALANVLSFRSLTDTRALISSARQHRRAVVIGGGFLGLEAAEGLRARGMAVTVLHRGGHLLNRQLDQTAGDMLKRKLQQRGLEILTDTAPKSLLGKEQVRAVELSNGTVLATDLVVIATGITPNTELASAAGLHCDRGVCVDAWLRTSDPAIHALGECCQLGQHSFGLLEPGHQQAQVLATHLCQPPRCHGFRPGDVATRLKISDLPIFSCGRIHPGPETEDIQWADRDQHRYGRLLIEGNRLVGAMLLGDTSSSAWYAALITSGQDISDYRNFIAFGKPNCDVAA